MLNLLVNPVAGGKNGKKMLKNLSLIINRLKEKNVAYKIFKTEKRGDATRLTQEIIKSGADNVVVVGGDGTLHETINGFSNFDKVALGIIPCGTGNDFAAALKIPENPVKAVDIILEEQPKFTDFMQMPTVRGLNIIGMGIDVDVLKYYAAAKKKTKLTYTKCLIKALAKFKCIDFSAQTDDGETIKYNSFMACVANGYRYGGGIPVCPTATPTDNKLDFLAVKNLSKLKMIFAFIKLKAGKILSLKQASHQNMSKINILPSTERYTVNVDGELYDDIPFSVEIVSDKLRVYRR